MYLISAEGYINAGFHFLRINKTDKIWISMKNVHDDLRVKNMFDLILKEIYGRYENKNILQLNKSKNTKWLRGKVLKRMTI